MNDVFRRMAGSACIAVVALLPASLSAQVLVIPSASTVPTDARGPTQTPPWHYHHMPPGSLPIPFWGRLSPLIGWGATGLAMLPAPRGLAVLNGGGPPLNPGLMSGAGNGNGNGNIGSNNGNGNFGTGDGTGNGGAAPSGY